MNIVGDEDLVENHLPEALDFLKLFRGKEQVLHRLALKDLEQRPKLGAEAAAAVENLGDIRKKDPQDHPLQTPRAMLFHSVLEW